MMWMRFLIVGFLSATAFSIFSYQGIEFYKSVVEYLRQK